MNGWSDMNDDVEDFYDDDEEPWADCDDCGQTGGHGLEGCQAEWECAFPGECLVPGFHHRRDECYTVQMDEEMAAYEAEMEAQYNAMESARNAAEAIAQAEIDVLEDETGEDE